jgi:hypothetical protein
MENVGNGAVLDEDGFKKEESFSQHVLREVALVGAEDIEYVVMLEDFNVGLSAEHFVEL